MRAECHQLGACGANFLWSGSGATRSTRLMRWCAQWLAPQPLWLPQYTPPAARDIDLRNCVRGSHTYSYVSRLADPSFLPDALAAATPQLTSGSRLASGGSHQHLHDRAAERGMELANGGWAAELGEEGISSMLFALFHSCAV